MANEGTLAPLSEVLGWNAGRRGVRKRESVPFGRKGMGLGTRRYVGSAISRGGGRDDCHVHWAHTSLMYVRNLNNEDGCDQALTILRHDRSFM